MVPVVPESEGCGLVWAGGCLTRRPGGGRKVSRHGQEVSSRCRRRHGSQRLVGTAVAHDDGSTGPIGIYSTTDYISPSGSRDQSYNGYRVFLSSPRHSDSRYRGECLPPNYQGYEENGNGRKFNWYAANGNYRGWDYVPDSVGRNLHWRGYQVAVSANVRDDGYIANRTLSRNWGSHAHIVSHSNASSGCASGTDTC